MADAPTERGGESAWSKLRRRKVAQWGIAYGAGAWAVLQGVAYLRDTFGWAYQIQQFATLLLLIVLPIVLVLAWYHGDRGQQRVTAPELALLTAMFLVGGALLWWLGRMVEPPVASGAAEGPTSSPAMATVARDDRSIAVLPFVNMSSDPEQEYFSDGVAEQVLDQLSRIPGLRVIARTSSFTFRGKNADVATIAQKLNVSHVLEGSVRKSRNRVRITAQLVRAADSSRLWSETYDRELTDIFAIQDEIAAAVVQQLKITLLGGAPPARMATSSVEAYRLYLQGRYMYERHGEQDMARAASLYQQALAIDPSYAAAWAALAQAQWVPADLGYSDVNQGARDALQSARTALALDPQSARAHLVMGLIQFAHEFDWPAADKSLTQALAGDPGDSDAILGAGFLALGLGRVDDAAALFQRAAERSPVSPSPHVWRGIACAISNRPDEAEKEIRTALQLSEQFSSGWYWLGVVLLGKGEPEAALTAMQREPAEGWQLPGLALAYHALRRDAESDAALDKAAESYGTVMAYQIGQVHAYRGEVSEAFAWLDRAHRQRDGGLAYFLKTDPLLDNIRADPRYAALLRKLGLPEG